MAKRTRLTERQLVAAARRGMKHAYAPYSAFTVGAALEASDGTVFTGCNVENASYGGTICAERTAMAAAVAAGKQRFRRIAIVSSGREPVTPCGLCRQFMVEFAPELEVISEGTDGSRQSWVLSELLPLAFRGKGLRLGRKTS